MLRRINQTSTIFKLLKNNCKYTPFRTFGLNYGETINFPRTETNLKLNWVLAKYLVTPKSGNVQVNSCNNGEASDGSSEVHRFDNDTNWPKGVHIQVAKKISSSENVYVEDGVFSGVNCRVVTANAEQASQARACLDPMVDENAGPESFNPSLVVLLDELVGAETLVSVPRRLIVSGGFYDVDFRTALSDMV